MAGSITNVFVLMLENHSFDNMFALSGIPGITAATTSDKNSYKGTDYFVQGGAPSQMPTDPGHEFQDVVDQLCGQGATYPSGGPYPAINNSGYAANYATSTSEGPAPPASKIGDIMKCFDTKTQLPVLYQLATEFAICDHWFSSMPGPTWPNRFFLHGASSAGLDHSPSTTEIAKWLSPIGHSYFGFQYPKGSIFDAMNNKKVKWRLYNDPSGTIVGAVPQVASLKGINQATDIHSVSGMASDLQKAYPYQYTFIEPNYGDLINSTYEDGSSQHPMDGVEGGEKLIKMVYEAVRNSPLWDTSMLIICYDEHGGFYDSVAPGPAPAPDDGSSSELNEFGFTFKQYGTRVPAVVVSPLIPQGTVDHTVYDHASVLATLEELFGLSPLTQRDAQANNVNHLFTLSSPRTDCPTTLNNPRPSTVAAALTSADRAEIDQQPLPKSGNLAGALAVMHKTDLELSEGDDAQREAIVENYKNLKTKGQARAYVEGVAAKLAEARA